MIRENEDMATEYVYTVVPHFWQALSSADDHVLVIEALHSLELISKFKDVLKFKQRTLLTVKPLLASSQRVVRKFARSCLNEWHLAK